MTAATITFAADIVLWLLGAAAAAAFLWALFAKDV